MESRFQIIHPYSRRGRLNVQRELAKAGLLGVKGLNSVMCRGVFGGMSGGGSPITYLSDTFTDINGTPLILHTMGVGAGWTASGGGFTIQSGQASGPAPHNTTDLFNWADAGHADGTASVQIATPNSNSYIGALLARLTSSGACFLFAIERDGGGTPYIKFYDFGGGSGDVTGSGGGSWMTNATGTMMVTCSGNVMSATYVVGGNTATVSKTTSVRDTATKFGMYSNNGGAGYDSVFFDNFLVTS